MTQIETSEGKAVVTFYTHSILMFSFNIVAVILVLVSALSEFELGYKLAMVVLAILFVTMNTYKAQTIFDDSRDLVTQQFHWLGFNFSRRLRISGTHLYALRFPEHIIYTIMLRIKSNQTTFNVGDFMTESELDKFTNKLLSVTDITYEKSL